MVDDQLSDVVEPGLLVSAAAGGLAVGGEQVPLRGARGERVRREDLDPVSQQVVPGLDPLGIALPDDTIKIDIDIATTKDAPAEAKSFLDYVLSKPAQEKFASWGYRPVNEEVLKANSERFPNPAGLFTIEDLGGWKKVNDELFDPERGSIAKIEEEAGVSTAK